MLKQARAKALCWLGVFGLVMMLAMSACESVVVEPMSTKSQPAAGVASSDEDPPQKPTRPPGGGE